MQTNRQPFRGLSLLIILMVLIIGWRHFDLVKAPNQFLIDNSVDGYRSYMAALYHIKHDAHYGFYEGMNYPYGDRVDFTDNIPLLTNTLKFISQNIVDLSPWMVGIWNCFLLLSILWSGIFLYLIFRELDLPLWYALPAALGICFLAPQHLRFDAHFGLAHPFVLPLIIYLLLRFERQPNIRNSLWIGGTILFTYSLHSYLFAISILLVGFYWVMKLLQRWSWATLRYVLLHGSLQTIVPFLILAVLVLLPDTISDRPLRPYGFFTYKAFPLSVFFPLEFHPGRILKAWRGPMEHITGEGMVYVGFSAFAFLVGSWTWWLWRRGKQAYLSNVPVPQSRWMAALLGAGLLLLLMSFGLPFTIPGVEYWLNYTGPFQQFRSIGRFAWAFYYAVNIVAFYVGYHWIKTIETKNWRIACFVLALGVLNFEAITFFFKHHYKLYPHPQLRKDYRAEDNPWLAQVDQNSYQAILPIPYFHVGSENIWFQSEAPILQRSMWASVQTGLPLLSSFMGRTSLSQTLSFATFVKEAYRPSAIFDLLNPQKSILIFVQKGNYEYQRAKYDHLMSGLRPFYEDHEIRLYELRPELLRERVKRHARNAFRSFAAAKLYEHGDLLLSDSLNGIIYQNFDHIPNERQYTGGGAFAGVPKIEHIVYEGHLPEQKVGIPYIFSMWAYVGGDLHPRMWFNIEEYDRSSGDQIWKIGYRLEHHIQAIDGDWALIEVPFRLLREDSGLRTTVINHDLFQEDLGIDELLIRPELSQVYRKEGQALWRNSRKYYPTE
ncbi:MAG: hypothetical protein AAGD05_01720 [Bacteroidota bacterium]